MTTIEVATNLSGLPFTMNEEVQQWFYKAMGYEDWNVWSLLFNFESNWIYELDQWFSFVGFTN